MRNTKCDGRTFFGITTEPCSEAATVHRWQDQHEQYNFCPKHDYFYFHGHFAGDEEGKKKCRECNPEHWLEEIRK